MNHKNSLGIRNSSTHLGVRNEVEILDELTIYRYKLSFVREGHYYPDQRTNKHQ